MLLLLSYERDSRTLGAVGPVLVLVIFALAIRVGVLVMRDLERKGDRRAAGVGLLTTLVPWIGIFVYLGRCRGSKRSASTAAL